MHKTIHIAVNINKELYYNISAIKLSSEVLKLKEVEELITMIEVNVCNNTVKLRYRTQKEIR